ncbi:MAG: GNAT family N-acetyltransferase [Bacteroidales bacterium]
MKPLSYLSNDIITLRALEPTDIDTLYRWENDSTLWETGNAIAPFSRLQLWKYIQSYDGTIHTTNQLRLIVELLATHEAIGTIDLYDYDPRNNRCYVGILIDSKYQRQGYGTQALTLANRYATEVLGIHSLAAIIATDNTPSLKLFTACNFTPTATLKDWLKRGTTYIPAHLLQYISC